MSTSTKIKLSLPLIFLTFYITTSGQVEIGGIINNYSKVTEINQPCNTITIENTSFLEIGDLVLIIQHQGAIIRTENTVNFGNIVSYNQAGNFEFNRVGKITNNKVQLLESLKNEYSIADKVQLVKIPEYKEDVTVKTDLTCEPWNGHTGGVLSFIVEGSVILEANISTRGLGFRGGTMVDFISTNANRCRETDYVASFQDNIGSKKGEGIADFIPTMEYGRGKQSNGGGGGNIHNAGGGGGSNFGAGGKGGKEWVRCGSPVLEIGGEGGQAINYNSFTNDRLFMGGGGGGGNENDDGGTVGANGGGIIIIKSKSIYSNGNTIDASGDTPSQAATLDSGGGGGGGGTVWLDIDNILTELLISVNGGNGGNVDEPNVGPNYIWGPGAGGGAGVIRVNEDSSNFSYSTNGGKEGVYICCSIINWDAESGDNGEVFTNLKIELPSILDNENYQVVSICEGDSIFFNGLLLSEEGLYWEELIDSNGCDSITYLDLTVNTNINIEVEASICEGNTYEFNGIVLNEQGIYNDTIININSCDSIITLSLTINEIFKIDEVIDICEGESYRLNGIDYSSSGFYSDTLTSADGCDSIIFLTLNVTPRHPDISHELSSCGSIHLNTTLDCEDKITWFDESNNIIGENQESIELNAITEDTFIYTKCEIGDCTVSKETFFISYNTDSTYSLPFTSNEFDLCENNQVILDLSESEFVFWISDQSTNILSITEPGEFYITVLEPINNCYFSIPIIITFCFEEDRYIPNAFTPNNDGINDIFRVYGPYSDDFHMSIYDRWGSKVFESWDYNEGWDGKIKGIDANPGVYIYKVEYKQAYQQLDEIYFKSIIRSGDVLLYR